MLDSRFKIKEMVSGRHLVWIGLGLLTILVSSAMSPDFVEKYYSRGLFPLIRWTFAALYGWLPFAFVYLLFFIVLGWLVYAAVRFFKSRTPWLRRLAGAFFTLTAFVGGVIFFFQLLWGFNYQRVPLETNLGISPAPMTTEQLRNELEIATAETLQARAPLAGLNDGAIAASHVPADLENVLRENLKALLKENGYPTPGHIRGRLLWPKGLLLRISTAGVYIPFTGEGHIDPGLHFLQLPFVMTHEMSHGYGFGDEGTCNFLAYLACTRSSNPFLNYVGHLYYWRYVASEYAQFFPTEYQQFRETLPEGLKADLLAIKQEMEKYPDIFPAVRDATYHAYLQAQGIEEGLKNYDRVIMLVHAWRQKSAH